MRHSRKGDASGVLVTDTPTTSQAWIQTVLPTAWQTVLEASHCEVQGSSCALLFDGDGKFIGAQISVSNVGSWNC